MNMLPFFVNALIPLLGVFAGAYRIPAYGATANGVKGTGLSTWFGVIVVFPIFAFPPSVSSPDDPALRPFLWSWAALAFCGYVRAIARWYGDKSADERISRCWLGRFELSGAMALAIGARQVVGEGAGNFFLVGYAASVAQDWLLRARDRLLPGQSSGLKLLISSAWDRAREAAPGVFSHGGQLLGIVMPAMMAVLPHLWPKPRPVVVSASDNVVYMQTPRLTFWQWFRRHLVVRTVIWFISGTIGIDILPLTFYVLFSIPVVLLGGKVEHPEFVTKPVWGIFSRAKEEMHEAKESAAEHWHEKKEEFTKGAIRVRERLEDKGDAIKEQAEGAVRKTFWGSIFG